MTFAFVHTADWQLGKPFGRFEADKAAVLRHARLDAIDRLAAVARAAGVTHVLVAGDVFDSETPADVAIRQAMARMASQAGIVWHLLPGNHDPARAGGVWQAAQALGVPEGVRLHLAPGPVEISSGVVLLPAPLAAKSTTGDPTAWMSEAATPAGTLRIGLAHGSIKGFGDLGEAAVPIAPDRARLAGLDYLALGDWHGMKQIGPATWYSGTPEPDGFSDNDPGHALIVRLGGERQRIAVEPVRTGAFHWLSRVAEGLEPGAFAAIERDIAAAPVAAGACLLDLTVTGRSTPAALTGLERTLARLEGALFSLRVDRTGLAVVATADDIDALPAGAVRDIAERLRQKAQCTDANADPAEARIAARALELLLTLPSSATSLAEAA